MSIVDPHVSSFCTIASRRRAWIWRLHGVFDHGEGSSWRTRLGKGFEVWKKSSSNHHKESYTVIHIVFSPKRSSFYSDRTYSPTETFTNLGYLLVAGWVRDAERGETCGETGWWGRRKWSSRISSINTVWETDQTDVTDVLCQSEIFCSLRHLRVDLGGHPDFLSASFFFWEACSWFHSCAVPVYLVSGWTAKEIFLKSEIQIPLSCKTFGIHSWESESWATPIWIDRGLGKQCNRHCQQTRVLYDDAVKMVSMARKLSLWCGSWPEILFHFCMGSRVNRQKCVYRLYLFRTLECTCDTASTYNQAGAVCLWRHWQLGVKECHGTGWCWYVLARTSLLGGSPQQVHGCGIIFSTLLRSFGTKRTGGTSL